MRKILRRSLFLVNALTSLALLLSFLAAYINPNDFLLPSFFGLAFVHLLVVNTLFLLFWLFTKPKYSLLSLVIVMLCVSRFENHFSWSEPAAAESSLKVMSYNVRLFDLYNWSDNKSTRNKMLDFIKETDADVLCMQEFFNSNDKKYFNTLDTLLKVQQANNVHDVYSAIMHDGLNQFGIATLSENNIVERGRIELDSAGHNLAIYTDILVGAETLRIMNLHLASIHLSEMEDDIENHLEENDSEKQWNDAKLLWKKLAGGFKNRAKQAEVIAQAIKDSPHKVIVCGDFNDTPASYAYHTIRGEMNDAFIERGKGAGTTYLGLFPTLRIDFILADPSIEILSFTTEDVELSDHRPLVTEFEITGS